MRNIIEIAGIILPVILIILSVTRIFMKRTKGFNGIIILCAILLLFIGLLQYFVFRESTRDEPGSKLPPLAVSAHSETFNRSVENVLSGYHLLSTAFGKSDTIAVNKHARELSVALDSFPVDELKIDTLIHETALQPLGNTKAEVSAIITDPSISEKLASFNLLSNELYTLLRIVRYDVARLYWMECPVAFGEDRPGNWLATTEDAPNPYGKEDCSEMRSTIDFVRVDSSATNDPVKKD